MSLDAELRRALKAIRAEEKARQNQQTGKTMRPEYYRRIAEQREERERITGNKDRRRRPS